MIGMFQSSRMASGSPRLQTSSAFSPSSASTIWKSNPSNMRLATFRMTLESSTTKHVFILASVLRSSVVTSNLLVVLSVFRISSRHHVRSDFEHPVDVEDDHQLPVEAMHAAGELGHARIEVDGILFAA